MLDNDLLEKLWLIFKSLGKESLSMSHYDLEEATDVDATVWKQFLLEPSVSEWVKSEHKLIQDSELKKLVKDVSKSRSVGQAQLMNTLTKLNEEKTIKDGPVFIYTYVPMNSEQAHAPNTNSTDKDIFMKEVKKHGTT